MNCTNLNTAAEILEAFRACKNPGEEIELFECLATRPDPPVGAFVDILRSIKLEAVLALTIQAFGKITDADIKARLKESQDLLTILSQQAQSGSSDLIRWSAATTIDNLGFDFIAVSQYLSEEPKKISEKIVQSKVKRFADRNLVNSNDYDEFVRFWVYGDRYRLREITLGHDFWEFQRQWQGIRGGRYPTLQDENFNKFKICRDVMNILSLRGIQEVNLSLQLAETMGDNAAATDENEVFEGIAQVISAELLQPEVTYSIDNPLIVIQLHCLQSNNFQTVLAATNKLFSMGKQFLDQLQQSKPLLATAVYTFSEDFFGLQSTTWNPSYATLCTVVSNLESLATNFTRKKIRLVCQTYYQQILQKKQERIVKSINLEEKLNKIKLINYLLYENVLSKSQNQLLQWLLDNQDNLAANELMRLGNEAEKFYDKFIYDESNLSTVNQQIKIAENALVKAKIIIIISITLVAVIVPYTIISLVTNWPFAAVIQCQGIILISLSLILSLGLGYNLDKISEKKNCYVWLYNLLKKPFENKLFMKNRELYSNKHKLNEPKRDIIKLLSL